MKRPPLLTHDEWLLVGLPAGIVLLTLLLWLVMPA